MSDSADGCGCFGCGCLITFIVFLFFVWAILFGVATPWGKFNIDLLPPRVWDMNTGAGK